MPHRFAEGPSGVISRRPESRRETCRQHRDRVASLRVATLGDIGRLRWRYLARSTESVRSTSAIISTWVTVDTCCPPPIAQTRRKSPSRTDGPRRMLTHQAAFDQPARSEHPARTVCRGRRGCGSEDVDRFERAVTVSAGGMLLSLHAGRRRASGPLPANRRRRPAGVPEGPGNPPAPAYPLARFTASRSPLPAWNGTATGTAMLAPNPTGGTASPRAGAPETAPGTAFTAAARGQSRACGHLPDRFRSGHSMFPSCLSRHHRAVSLSPIPCSGPLSFAVSRREASRSRSRLAPPDGRNRQPSV